MTQTKKPQADRSDKRSNYLVDPRLQGMLVRQAIYYWLWTTITFGLIILFSRVTPAWLSGIDHPSSHFWYHLGPYITASAVLFPIVMFHTLRASHRFAGPMVRVRRALKELAQGKTPDQLKFRDKDYWGEMAEDINRISAKLSEQPPATSNCVAREETVPSCGDEDALFASDSAAVESAV